MENEPDKWEEQTWILPGVWGLVRNGKTWHFIGMQDAVKIQIDNFTGEHLAKIIGAYQIEVSRRHRRSLLFRWQRFWYLRKHRKRQ